MARTVVPALWTFLAATSASAAGTISSGGGLIYDDQLNPWFLENTQEVTWCVDEDDASFGLARDRAAAQIDDALATWKRAFAEDAAPTSYPAGLLEPFGQVRIATQTFKQEECRDSTMLHFQLGKLSDVQRAYLPRPEQAVAQTVRVAYETRAMRGTGFIFVSPETGDLAPTSPLIDVKRWSYCDGCIFRRVVLHELGHVFGLPHMGATSDLMNAQYPEFLVQRAALESVPSGDWPKVAETLKDIKIFGYDRHNERGGCSDVGPPTETNAFLGIPVGWLCHRMTVDYPSRGMPTPEVRFYAAPVRGAGEQLVGSVWVTAASMGSQAAVVLKLPTDQKVFTKLPPNNGGELEGYLDGPGVYQDKVFEGTYTSADGRISRPVKALTRQNGYLDIEGILDSRFVSL